MQDIAESLNRDGVVSPGGGRWDRSKIRRILLNELYVGTLVYNRTTQKLKTPTRHNPKSEWIRTPGAFEPIVERTVFDEAQRLVTQAAMRYTPEYMLEQLRRVLDEHELVRPGLLRADPAAPAAATYAKPSGSHHFDTTFQVEGTQPSSNKCLARYRDFFDVSFAPSNTTPVVRLSLANATPLVQVPPADRTSTPQFAAAGLRNV